MRRRALLGLLVLCAAAPAEPNSYRNRDYGAPTPATLRGAQVLSTGQAHALWQAGGAVFVDVLPQAPRPPSLPAGTIWHRAPRLDIPRSIWLPDTGYGELAAATERYFESGLAQAAGGDRGRLVVFYCKPQCWMSWNAAKRALALGYTRVAWYPDGAAGWQAAGYAVEPRMPMPGQPGAAPATE